MDGRTERERSIAFFLMYLASEDAEPRANKNRLNQKKKVKEYHPACVHLCGCFQSDRVLTLKERDKKKKLKCVCI